MIKKNNNRTRCKELGLVYDPNVKGFCRQSKRQQKLFDELDNVDIDAILASN